MSQPTAEFWIDVGGTFTDCFARFPDGRLARHKLLSSGAVKGAASIADYPTELIDSNRRGDPPGHWRGFRLELLDALGRPCFATIVEQFDAQRGAFQLAEAVPAELFGPTVPYELTSGEVAPLMAIRYLLGLRLDETIPSISLRLGTTRGTNALLTRSGARTALVTTAGFGDALLIGDQQRPKLFELNIKKRVPLFETVVEIEERVDAAGNSLKSPHDVTVREQLRKLREEGIESLAVCLLNSYRNPQHEEQVARIASELGFEEVSISSRVSPLIKLISRGDTTCVDAYLNPVLRTYLASLAEKLPEGDVRILSSAGGLVTADQFVGKDSILSGPAGGVVGFASVAENAGFAQAIGFDMGGTSTDVARYDGGYTLEYETVKAGVRIVSPMMAIETVAAGGGSICSFDGVKLVVGPASAGADPGPACYGRGGPLAVTDINLALGKIAAEQFPFPLDQAAMMERLEACRKEVRESTGADYTPIELADGFLKITNANMAAAISSVSIAQGIDPRDYVLVAFGGAAAQHACAVARELGIRQILSHPDAGILSAYGIGQANITRFASAGIYEAYSNTAVIRLEKRFQELAADCRRQIVVEGISADQIAVHRSLDLCYVGYDAALTVADPQSGDYAAAFAEQHRRLYGYTHEKRELEIVAARVEAVGQSRRAVEPSRRVANTRRIEAEQTRTVYFDAAPHPTRLFDRADLKPGDLIAGPAVVIETMSTTVVDPGWQAEMLTGGELLLTDARQDETGAGLGVADSAEADPVMLEIFNNQFASIAEQMGITLRNTSISVNVKERLDFSCALFTPEGNLVVNAPHIPVHLGAMGETVRCILKDNPMMQPGDVFVTNDPYRGGSHLPDVTVVTPVYGEDSRLLFFTASRAHHAEIGGITPGSMPPFSKSLAEEGVLIRNFRLVAAGASREAQLRELLLSPPYPTRCVEENLADVAAQVAANRQGATDLLRLIERFSLPVVQAYMHHIQAAAERKTRQAIAKLPDGEYAFEDHLDDGTPIRVKIIVDGDHARIDFTGTGPPSQGNFNANRAIVSSAVLYCLRCLLQEEIPLNEGVLAPVEIVLPQCLLNPVAGASSPGEMKAEDCPAVVGGNVETSQRIVDCLLGALRLAAASQGTMNNLIFGDEYFGYYETIGGGAGATADAAGADAVHTHMTNTRLTDPEVLEARYPVRLREFSIRRGSGGQGKHRGGDGIVREIEFLQPLQVSLLTQRRGRFRPYGMEGGQPGAAGLNEVVRRDGRREVLEASADIRCEAGDILRIETPGGGGCGPPEQT